MCCNVYNFDWKYETFLAIVINKLIAQLYIRDITFKKLHYQSYAHKYL